MKSKNGSKGGKMGGKKNTGYRNRGKTEVGKEAKVQSYKEYVQKDVWWWYDWSSYEKK
jgi:hypothetical protein